MKLKIAIVLALFLLAGTTLAIQNPHFNDALLTLSSQLSLPHFLKPLSINVTTQCGGSDQATCTRTSGCKWIPEKTSTTTKSKQCTMSDCNKGTPPCKIVSVKSKTYGCYYGSSKSNISSQARCTAEEGTWKADPNSPTVEKCSGTIITENNRTTEEAHCTGTAIVQQPLTPPSPPLPESPPLPPSPSPTGATCEGTSKGVIIQDGQYAYTGGVDNDGDYTCSQCQNGNWVPSGKCKPLHESGANVVTPPVDTAEGEEGGDRRSNCSDKQGDLYVTVGDGATRADGKKCLNGSWVDPVAYTPPEYVKPPTTISGDVDPNQTTPVPALVSGGTAACSTSYTTAAGTTYVTIPSGESALGGAATTTETGERTAVKICKNGEFVPCNEVNRADTPGVTNCTTPTILPTYMTQNKPENATCVLGGGYQLPSGRVIAGETSSQVCKNGNMVTIPVIPNDIGNYLLGTTTGQSATNLANLQTLCLSYGQTNCTGASLTTFATGWLANADPAYAQEVERKQEVAKLYDVALGKDPKLSSEALAKLKLLDSQAYDQAVIAIANANKLQAQIDAEQQKSSTIEEYYNVVTNQGTPAQLTALKQDCLRYTSLIAPQSNATTYDCNTTAGLNDYAMKTLAKLDPAAAAQAEVALDPQSYLADKLNRCRHSCTSATRDCAIDEKGNAVCVTLTNLDPSLLPTSRTESLGTRTINFHKEECGAQGETCCLDQLNSDVVFKGTSATSPCAYGTVCAGDSTTQAGKCEYDTKLSRSIATTALIKEKLEDDTPASSETISQIVQNNAYVDPQSVAKIEQTTSSFCAASCGPGGVCAYSDATHNYACSRLTGTKLTQSYTQATSTLPPSNSDPAKGGLGQSCYKPVWYHVGKGSCDNDYLACDGGTCEISETGQTLLTVNSISKNPETLALNLTTLSPSVSNLAQSISANPALVKTGCNTSYSAYEQNGSCWICWDSTTKSVQKAPDAEYCHNPALADTLPGKSCQTSGGYCAQNTDALGGALNSGQNGCPPGMSCLTKNANFNFDRPRGGTVSWVNEACDGNTGRVCNNGLTCLDETCIDPIALSFNSAYQEGLLADAIRDNTVINAIPGVNFLVDHIVAPITAAFAPSYYQSSSLQADVAQGMVTNALAKPEIKDALPSNFILNTLETISGDAKVKYGLNTLNDINESSSTNVEGSIIYKTLANLSFFTGAWTERYVDPAGPRTGADIPAGAPVDNAFYGYASTYADPNATGIEKFLAAGNYGMEITFVVGDAVTLGFGDSLFTKGASWADKTLVKRAAGATVRETAELAFEKAAQKGTTQAFISATGEVVGDALLRGVSTTLSRPKVWGETIEKSLGRSLASAVVEKTTTTALDSTTLAKGASEVAAGFSLASISNTYAAQKIAQGISTLTSTLGLNKDDSIITKLIKDLEVTADNLLDVDTDFLYKLAKNSGFKGGEQEFVTNLAHQTILRAPTNLITTPLSPSTLNQLDKALLAELYTKSGSSLSKEAEADLVLILSKKYTQNPQEVKTILSMLTQARSWGIDLADDQIEPFIRTLGTISSDFVGTGPLSRGAITTLAAGNSLSPTLTRQLTLALENTRSPLIMPLTRSFNPLDPSHFLQTQELVTNGELLTRLQLTGLSTKEAANLSATLVHNQPSLFAKPIPVSTKVLTGIPLNNSADAKIISSWLDDTTGTFKNIKIEGGKIVPNANTTLSQQELNLITSLNDDFDTLLKASNFTGLRDEQIDADLRTLVLLAQTPDDSTLRIILNPTTGGGKNTVLTPLLAKYHLDRGSTFIESVGKNQLADALSRDKQLVSLYGAQNILHITKDGSGQTLIRNLAGNDVPVDDILARLADPAGKPFKITMLTDDLGFALNDVVALELGESVSNPKLAQMWTDIFASKPAANIDEMGTLTGRWMSSQGIPMAIAKLSGEKTSIGLKNGQEILDVFAETADHPLVQGARDGTVVLSRNAQSLALDPLTSAQRKEAITSSLKRAQQELGSDSPAHSIIQNVLNQPDLGKLTEEFDALRRASLAELQNQFGDDVAPDLYRAMRVGDAHHDALYSRLSVISMIPGDEYTVENGLIKLAKDKAITNQQYSAPMQALALQEEGLAKLNATGVALADLEVNSRSIVSDASTLFDRLGAIYGTDATDALPKAKFGFTTLYESIPLHEPQLVKTGANLEDIAQDLAATVRTKLDNGEIAMVIDMKSGAAVGQNLDQTAITNLKAITAKAKPGETFYVALLNGDGTQALYKIDPAKLAGASSIDDIGELIAKDLSPEELYEQSVKLLGDENNKVVAYFQNRTRGTNFKPPSGDPPKNIISEALVVGDATTFIKDETFQSAGRLRGYASSPYSLFLSGTTESLSPRNAVKLALSNQERVVADETVGRLIKQITSDETRQITSALRQACAGNPAFLTELKDFESQISHAGLAFPTTPTREATLDVLYKEYETATARKVAILARAQKAGVSPDIISDLTRRYSLTTPLSKAEFGQALAGGIIAGKETTSRNLIIATLNDIGTSFPSEYTRGSTNTMALSDLAVRSGFVQTTTPTLASRITQPLTNLMTRIQSSITTALTVIATPLRTLTTRISSALTRQALPTPPTTPTAPAISTKEQIDLTKVGLIQSTTHTAIHNLLSQLSNTPTLPISPVRSLGEGGLTPISDSIRQAIASLLDRPTSPSVPSQKIEWIDDAIAYTNTSYIYPDGYGLSFESNKPSLVIVNYPAETHAVMVVVSNKTPLNSPITINGKTSTLQAIFSGEDSIFLNYGDILTFGNTTVKIVKDSSNANGKVTTISRSTTPDPKLDLPAQLDNASKLTGTARREAIDTFRINLQTRYQTITRLQNNLAQKISDNPNITRDEILNLTFQEAQNSQLTNAEINNLLFAVNSYMLQHTRIQELRQQYLTPISLWQAAFGFVPQGIIRVEYSYSTINFISNDHTDFARAYKTPGNVANQQPIQLTPKEVANVINKVGGFHKNSSSLIPGTENIFNVDRADQDLVDTIAHEDQHSLFQTIQLALFPNIQALTPSLDQNKLQEQISSLSSQLNLESDYLSVGNITRLNLTENEQHQITQAHQNQQSTYVIRPNEIIYYDPTNSSELFYIYRGQNLAELASVIARFSFNSRLGAEINVANEILAQIAGNQKTGKSWDSYKEDVVTALQHSNYTYFVDNLAPIRTQIMKSIPQKSSTHDVLDQYSQNGQPLQQYMLDKYFSADAQNQLVQQAVNAFGTLLSKGYSHAEAAILLQSIRLANWTSLARRLPTLETPTSSPFTQLKTWFNSLFHNSQSPSTLPTPQETLTPPTDTLIHLSASSTTLDIDLTQPIRLQTIVEVSGKLSTSGDMSPQIFQTREELIASIAIDQQNVTEAVARNNADKLQTTRAVVIIHYTDHSGKTQVSNIPYAQPVTLISPSTSLPPGVRTYADAIGVPYSQIKLLKTTTGTTGEEYYQIRVNDTYDMGIDENGAGWGGGVQVTSSNTTLPYESRVSQALTGYTINDTQQLVTKLLADQVKILAETELLKPEIRRTNPKEYLDNILGVAAKHNIPIKSFDEIPQQFQNEIPATNAFYDDSWGTDAVYVKNPTSLDPTELGKLAHETVHAIDYRNNPELPIEIKEYRAYIAEYNLASLTTDPITEIQKTLTFIFGDKSIAGSIRGYLNQHNITTMPWETNANSLVISEETDLGIPSSESLKTTRARINSHGQDLGYFILKELSSPVAVQRQKDNYHYLKEHGFPVPPEMIEIPGRPNTLGFTDLTHNGKLELYSFNTPADDIPQLTKINNIGVISQSLQDIATRADELGIIIPNDSYFIIIDSTTKTGQVIIGDFGNAPLEKATAISQFGYTESDTTQRLTEQFINIIRSNLTSTTTQASPSLLLRTREWANHRYQNFKLNQWKNRLGDTLSDAQKDEVINTLKAEPDGNKLISVLVSHRTPQIYLSKLKFRDDNDKVTALIQVVTLARTIQISQPKINPHDLLNGLLNQYSDINWDKIQPHSTQLSNILLSNNPYATTELFKRLSNSGLDLETALPILTSISELLRNTSYLDTWDLVSMIGEKPTQSTLDTLVSNLNPLGQILRSIPKQNSQNKVIQDGDLFPTIHDLAEKENATNLFFQISLHIDDLVISSQTFNNRFGSNYSGEVMVTGLKSPNLETYLNRLNNLTISQRHHLTVIFNNIHNLGEKKPIKKQFNYLNSGVTEALRVFTLNDNPEESFNFLDEIVKESNYLPLATSSFDKNYYLLETLKIINADNFSPDHIFWIFNHLKNEPNIGKYGIYPQALKIWASMNNDEHFATWLEAVKNTSNLNNILNISALNPSLAPEILTAINHLSQYFPENASINISYLLQYSWDRVSRNNIPTVNPHDIISLNQDIATLELTTKNYPGETGKFLLTAILEHKEAIELARTISRRPSVFRPLFSASDTMAVVKSKLQIIANGNTIQQGIQQVRLNALQEAMVRGIKPAISKKIMDNPPALSGSATNELIRILDLYQYNSYYPSDYTIKPDSLPQLSSFISSLLPGIPSEQLTDLTRTCSTSPSFLLFITSFKKELLPYLSRTYPTTHAYSVAGEIVSDLFFTPALSNPELWDANYFEYLSNNPNATKEELATNIISGLTNDQQIDAAWGIIQKQDVDQLIATLSREQQRFWQTFRDYPLLRNRWLEPGGIEFFYSLSADQINIYTILATKIDESPVSLIQKIKEPLIVQLLQVKDPVGTYENIDRTLTYNNLPEFIKLIRVFNYLYPKTILDSKISFRTSPAIQAQKSDGMRRLILQLDLFHAAVESGNRNLESYLSLFSDYANLVDQFMQGKELDPPETKQVVSFITKMDALYRSSNLTRIRSGLDLDLQQAFNQTYLRAFIQNTLYTDLSITPETSLIGRIEELFLHNTGYTSLRDIVSHMQGIRAETTSRNLAYASTHPQLTLDAGDLTKAMVTTPKTGVILSILENGPRATELMGDLAGNDSTPLDTDLFMTTIADAQVGYQTAIQQSLASTTFGSLIFVTKNLPNRFYRSDLGESAQKGQFELFVTGVIDAERHVGIRGAYPSSYFDAIINNGFTESELDTLYQSIMLNGFYIPVYSKEGQLIFTPQMYADRLKFFAGVHEQPLKVTTLTPQDIFAKLIKHNSLDPDPSVNSQDIQRVETPVRAKIHAILTSFGISLAENPASANLTDALLINIGSSGRGTNLPKDYDFDYTLILNRRDFKQSGVIAAALRSTFPHLAEIYAASGESFNQVRFNQVNLPELTETIDLDVGITTREDSLLYSSNQAVSDRLNSLPPPDKQQVVSNILLAKKLLKDGHAYKAYEDGGFGGIGVENWILSHNGNIREAFKSFWQASHDQKGNELTLDEFRKNYPLFDPGTNLRGQYFDDYINKLNNSGYQNMLKVINQYLRHQSISSSSPALLPTGVVQSLFTTLSTSPLLTLLPDYPTLTYNVMTWARNLPLISTWFQSLRGQSSSTTTTAPLSQQLDDFIDPQTDCLTSNVAYLIPRAHASSSIIASVCPLWEKTIVQSINTLEKIFNPKPPHSTNLLPILPSTSQCGQENQACCDKDLESKCADGLIPTQWSNSCQCTPILDPNDNFCWGKVLHFSSSEDSEVCINGCIQGSCAAVEGSNCSKQEEQTVKPNSANKDRYLFCNNGIWNPIGNNHKITFVGCSNAFSNAHLKALLPIQDYIFPNSDLEITCGSTVGFNTYFKKTSSGYTSTISMQCDPVQFPTDCATTLTHELSHAWVTIKNQQNIFSRFLLFTQLDPYLKFSADNQSFNQAIGCQLSQKDPKDPNNNLYSYSKETAVDDDKYGPFIEYKDGIASSHLGCWEAFALANNHYVYNSQYQHDNYPIQYEWIKNNIYQSHEFLTAP
ncbi:MAG: hypothetical protein V1487_00710 [bacterium]